MDGRYMYRSSCYKLIVVVKCIDGSRCSRHIMLFVLSLQRSALLTFLLLRLTGAEGERAMLINFQDNIAVVIMILIDSVKF